jgi:hypothetical protein
MKRVAQVQRNRRDLSALIALFQPKKVDPDIRADSSAVANFSTSLVRVERDVRYPRSLRAA